MSAGGFDWPALMRAGMRGLGLSPEAFWRLTPAELLLMLASGRAGAPLGRARLEELARAYPDPGPESGPEVGPEAGPEAEPETAAETGPEMAANQRRSRQ